MRKEGIRLPQTTSAAKHRGSNLLEEEFFNCTFEAQTELGLPPERTRNLQQITSKKQLCY